MRLDPRLEGCRIRSGEYASESGDLCGAFEVQGPCGEKLRIIADNGTDTREPTRLLGWEHVSVSTPRRIPNWQEMCFVKDLFWDSEDCVVQYHPPKSRYVNMHPRVLHLWRPIWTALPQPPLALV